MATPHEPQGRDDNPAFYWSIDVPGMTGEQASRLRLLISEAFGLHAIDVDPNYFCSLHMDRETIRTVRTGLHLLEQQNPAEWSSSGAASLAETLDEWLGWAAQGPD